MFTDCGVPSITDGTAEVPGGTTFDEVALVKCNEGYARNGDALITCLANGNWSVLPTCTIIGMHTNYIYGNTCINVTQDSFW